MRVKINVKGDFKLTEKFFIGVFNRLPRSLNNIFNRYGQMGVEALRNYTPKDTGETADSWTYEVDTEGIRWYNAKEISGGTPLVILLQYGHGTGNGGYVQGIDFINPALKPVFDQIADDCWREVQNL